MMQELQKPELYVRVLFYQICTEINIQHYSHQPRFEAAGAPRWTISGQR